MDLDADEEALPELPVEVALVALAAEEESELALEKDDARRVCEFTKNWVLKETLGVNVLLLLLTIVALILVWLATSTIDPVFWFPPPLLSKSSSGQSGRSVSKEKSPAPEGSEFLSQVGASGGESLLRDVEL